MPEELPSLTARAASLSWAVMKWGLNGFKKPTADVYRERLDICSSCDRLRDDTTCVDCGCIVTWKAGMADQECPLKKWLAIVPAKVQETAPSYVTRTCKHRYVTHTYVNQSNPKEPILEVTMKCRDCGVPMMFPDNDHSTTLKARFIPTSEAGT